VYGPTLVTSGYRSPAHNARVGGAPRSVHMAGQGLPGVAADVKCSSGTPRAWYALLDELGPGGLGLYAGHVHVDTRPGRARW
jgi:zinc D-Ala-D-Ala carboxypeptidase